MSDFPSGTVTLLFTDIEGSTRLWEEHPQAMRVALARHDALVRQAIEDNSGHVFKTIGDAFCAAFTTTPNALNAALISQVALHAELWPEGVSLRVRMALHTGTAELRGGDYFGQSLNRVARMLVIGHGGQVLLSLPTEELTRDTLPANAALKSMGEHRLKDLGRPETVFQLLHPDLPSEFPPLKSLDNPELPNNLPQQVTSFVGREKEIEAVKSLMGKTRLLTLTGSGGCGKTRLGLQVAADVLENYPDGAWLVELASLADPALVPQAVASVLGVREEAGKALLQTLVAFLKTKRLLLVLDNCEHVLDACSRLVDTLIRACPGVRVLASSREGLGIAGELIYRIPSLSLPDPRQTATVESINQYEAVQLFIARALFHLPTFAVTNQNAPALASVCHRLDGIPLAIELSAARVRSLSVEEINSKLDNRFRLLTGGSRTALPRQQTLRALIDWSFDLLTPQEKVLLCRLSVFAGGWTVEAAEQVGSAEVGEEAIEEWEVLDLLTSLADKSLVMVQISEGATRYRLLETVRQYARDRLAENGESLLVRAWHGDYFLKLAAEIHPKLFGPEQGQWLAALEEEHDNLRQALILYSEDVQDEEAGEKGMRMGNALAWFWWLRGYTGEGRERLRTLLAHPAGQEPTNARASALNSAGMLAYRQGDYAQARVLYGESQATFRELGLRNRFAITLLHLGNIDMDEGDYAHAQVLYEEGLAIYREFDDKNGIANTLTNLGILASKRGDNAQAHIFYEEGLAIRRELGNKLGIATNLNNLGELAQEQGDYAKARVLHQECLGIVRQLGNKEGIAYCLEAFALLAAAEREERCACLWGAAVALRETIGSPLPPAERKKQEREITAVRERLGEEAFAAAWTQGQVMAMEQAIEYALSEPGVTSS